MRRNIKLMKILRLAAICALMASLTSCATIFTATKYPVAFNTTPEGAGITIENREGKVIFEGVTPTTVKLKSSAGYMKKEEYKITFANIVGPFAINSPRRMCSKVILCYLRVH